METIRQVGHAMWARVFREVALAAARASRALATPRYLIGLVTLASAMALLSFGAAQAQTATTTQLISAPNPSAAGESVTFTATVVPATPGAQPPTGTVTFFDGGNQIGTGTLTAEGSASFAIFSTGTLSVGTHTITSNYPGDANFGGSNGGPLTQTVNKNNTTTLIVASPNPSTVGQPGGFDIVISPVTPTLSTVFPTGTVTVFDNGKNIGTATFTGGGGNSSFSFITATLTAGSHTITTSYGGDANFNGSNGSVTQIVNQATGVPSSTGVTSSPNPSTFGQQVTFTATVASAAPAQSSATPTGTVAFLDKGSTIGTGTLSGGVATFTTSALAVGSHTITADYSGDATFATSTASLAAGAQIVNKSNSSTTIASSPNPSGLTQLVTFMVNVSAVSPGSGTPTGTVTFLDNGNGIGTGTLSGGVATFTTSALAVGNHPITASYEL